MVWLLYTFHVPSVWKFWSSVNIDILKPWSLPFKYHALLIKIAKLSDDDCGLRVDKITNKVRMWSSRHLPFESPDKFCDDGITGF